jgi:hypothetical protein
MTAVSSDRQVTKRDAVPATVLYMSVSLDGFIARPNESPDNSLGADGSDVGVFSLFLSEAGCCAPADLAVYPHDGDRWRTRVTRCSLPRWRDARLVRPVGHRGTPPITSRRASG